MRDIGKALVIFCSIFLMGHGLIEFGTHIANAKTGYDGLGIIFLLVLHVFFGLGGICLAVETDA